MLVGIRKLEEETCQSVVKVWKQLDWILLLKANILRKTAVHKQEMEMVRSKSHRTHLVVQKPHIHTHTADRVSALERDRDRDEARLVDRHQECRNRNMTHSIVCIVCELCITSFSLAILVIVSCLSLAFRANAVTPCLNSGWASLSIGSLGGGSSSANEYHHHNCSSTYVGSILSRKRFTVIKRRVKTGETKRIYHIYDARITQCSQEQTYNSEKGITVTRWTR